MRIPSDLLGPCCSRQRAGCKIFWTAAMEGCPQMVRSQGNGAVTNSSCLQNASYSLGGMDQQKSATAQHGYEKKVRYTHIEA